MADTFISGNQDTIVKPLGGIVADYSLSWPWRCSSWPD